MKSSKDKKDFCKQIQPLLAVLDKQTKYRSEDELNQLVQVLRKTKLFTEICLMAQSYEIKHLLQNAQIVTQEVGDIFNEHQSEFDCLYMIVQGQMWTLIQDQLSFTERIAPLPSLNQYPIWWYLADTERLRQQFYLLMDQMIKRQGAIKLNDLSNMIRIQKEQYSSLCQIKETKKSLTVPKNKWGIVKDQFVPNHYQDAADPREKKIYHAGDFFLSKIKGNHYNDTSKEVPVLFSKMTCLLIKIPQISFTIFFEKILQRLRQQEHEYFKSLSIFSELTNSDVQDLHNQAKISEFRRGAVVYKQGDDVSEFYVVRQGEVEVSSNCPLSLVGEGQVIGEVDVILNHKIRQHTVTVRSHQCVLYEFAKANFFRQIHSKSKEEQISLCKSQEKYAKKKYQFCEGNLENALQIFKIKKKQFLVRPLQKVDLPIDLNRVTKNYSLPQQNQSSMQRSDQGIPTRPSRNSPGYIRSTSPKISQNYSFNKSKILRSLQVRLANPLVKRIELTNDRLDEMKSVQAYYNKLSKTMHCQDKSIDTQTYMKRLVNQTVNVDDCVNSPPQNIRKTLKYLKFLTGNQDMEMNSNSFFHQHLNEDFMLSNSRIRRRLNPRRVKTIAQDQGSHFY